MLCQSVTPFCPTCGGSGDIKPSLSAQLSREVAEAKERRDLKQVELEQLQEEYDKQTAEVAELRGRLQRIRDEHSRSDGSVVQLLVVIGNETDFLTGQPTPAKEGDKDALRDKMIDLIRDQQRREDEGWEPGVGDLADEYIELCFPTTPANSAPTEATEEGKS